MMTVLAEIEGKIYETVAIDDPGDLRLPVHGELFTCLLWDHGSLFTEEKRSLVAKMLLDSGCRYVVCGGEYCELWHDAVDAEFVEQHLGEPEETVAAVHVMTTRHQGESPDDVAFFFILNTNFDNHDFQRYLVLHVGTSEAQEHIDAAVRKYALSEKSI